ncbi:MAG: LytR C-terminal domain-containing protein [Nocardioides sp.]
MDSRARSAVTLGVLVMLCLVGILIGIRALTADLPTDPLVETTSDTCENRIVDKGKKIRAEEITVSVYNAGTKAGAASQVMKELQTRGFADGESGNAPKGTEVIRAQVWADSPRNSAARLVARQLGSDIKVFAGKPALGPGIVVVVGDRLGKIPKAPAETRAAVRTRICSPPVG